MSNDLLKLKNVRKEYGGIVPVQDVSMDIGPGDVCALIGPNGAGKTTLLNIITGLISVTSGSIEFRNTDATSIACDQMAKRGLARTFQITSIFPSCTVFESIWIAVQSSRGLLDSMLFSSSRRAVDELTYQLLERLNLTHVKNVPASSLSYGDQRVLEFGIALAKKPVLLLLDEPTAGMSPAETERLIEIIADLKETLAIIIVEHDMDVVMRVAERVFVLDRGLIVAAGTPNEISANSLVQSIYLGGH